LLPASATTLAEVFREAGYATVGFASIPFVGRFTNLHQGYEEFHEPGSLQVSKDAKTAREYMGRFLPWLERHRDTPFFALLHVADPHSPYFPYEPYGEIWGEPGDADDHRAALEQVRPHIAHPLMRNFGMPLRSELEKAGLDPEVFVDRELDAYDGSIRGLDVEIGRLLEQLDYLGLRDEVLIAFVSDHGTEFLDHDAHFHGHSAYGELNRVPMFFWGPRFVPAGVEIPGTVQTIDLTPTLLELAGLPVPEEAQGRSFASFVRAGKGAAPPEPRPAFTEKAMIGGPSLGLPGRDFASYAVVSEGWKLIWNQQPLRGLPEYELFDHQADPLNLHDVAAEHPERVSGLRRLIEEWKEAAMAARLDPASTEGMSAEDLERLRALGYVQ
jgi:iduronate 2-sulfatase